MTILKFNRPRDTARLHDQIAERDPQLAQRVIIHGSRENNDFWVEFPDGAANEAAIRAAVAAHSPSGSPRQPPMVGAAQNARAVFASDNTLAAPVRQAFLDFVDAFLASQTAPSQPLATNPRAVMRPSPVAVLGEPSESVTQEDEREQGPKRARRSNRRRSK